jgi:16S rRNA processing protein RimM
MTDKFIIGQIGAPFGLKGSVKVRSMSGEIEHLLELESVVLSKDGKERIYKIEESSPALPAVLMRFEGINNPEAAKALNGAQLIAGREHSAPLGEDEHYIEDLKGLPVVAASDTKNDDLIGHVTDIIEGGGGDLVEIKLIGGEKKLVPFRKDFFHEINLKKGKIVLQNLWILE